ncbi:hypothetical protein GCM10009798_13020 [Nocardioides panacihumi]|uniref:Apea-like HEPN domain-containing protein n=1 Tax=Nocardioides panacihumi TaxID=400774 RepID=A0ABN2QNC2_9ACTN
MFALGVAENLAAEMSRCTSSRQGWSSTLLTQSSVRLIEELLVAGAAVSNSVLGGASFDDLKGQVRERLLIDPGFGNQPKRGALANSLPKKAEEFAPRTHRHVGVRQLVPQLRADYLPNWAASVTDPQAMINTDPSSAATLLTAFLLGEGVHPAYLSRWLDYRRKHEPRTMTLGDLIHDLIDLIGHGEGTAEALVMLAQTVKPEVRSGPGWITRRQVNEWLDENGLGGNGLVPRTMHGGIILRGSGRDIDGILESASEAVHRVTHAALLKTGVMPKFHRLVWIKGLKAPRTLPSRTRLEHLLPNYDIPEPIMGRSASDDRLEVAVESIQASVLAGGAAAAGMLWATVEGLFGSAGDQSKLVSGERAADVATIAWIRFALTNTMGALIGKQGDPIFSSSLAGLSREASMLALVAFLQGSDFSGIQSTRVVSQARHTADFLRPQEVRRLRAEILTTFKGLYRQRNLILHGGVTDAPLLAGILRSSTPLVTAAVNRFAANRAGAQGDPMAFAFAESLRLDTHLADPTGDLLTLAGY